MNPRTLLDDVRAFGRRFRRRPRTVGGPILLLGCGLAVSVLIYSLLDQFYFRPLPFDEVDRVVAIYLVTPAEGSAASEPQRGPVPKAAWDALRKSSSLEQFGGWFRRRAYWGFPVEDIVERWYASSSLFTALGVRAANGRLFVPTDDVENNNVAILSWECWQRRFGAKSDIVGTTITITDPYIVGAVPEAKQVIGVLPKSFSIRGQQPEVVLSLGEVAPNVPPLSLIGRLGRGLTTNQANEMANSVVGAALQGNGSTRVQFVPLRADWAPDAVPPGWLLVAVAVAILAVTVTGAAGPLLNDMLARRQEFAVRLSLGANEKGLRSAMLVEHTLRSLLSASLGVVLATGLLAIIRLEAPADLTQYIPQAISLRVLSLGLIGSLLASITFGLIPLVLFSRMSYGLGVSGSPLVIVPRLHIQKLIATVQLACAFVFLSVAVLLGRTLHNLTTQPIGFETSNIAVMSYRTTVFPDVVAPPGEMPVTASWIHTDRLLESIRALPGVIHAAAATSAPFGTPVGTLKLRSMAPLIERDVEVQVQNTTSDYWATLGIRVVHGRTLTSDDRKLTRGERRINVVISETLNRLVGGSSLGKELTNPRSGEILTVVGIVDDVRSQAVSSAGPPLVYFFNNAYNGVNDVVVRTSQPAESMLPAIRHAMVKFDSTIVVTKAATLDALLSGSIAAERFRSSLGLILGVSTTSVAAIGIFLLGTRLVQLRSLELGVRVVCGASPMDIVHLVLFDGLLIGVAGVSVGLPISYIVANAARSWLFGVSAMDPVTMAIAVMATVLAVLAAMLRPVWQAVHVDPITILKR